MKKKVLHLLALGGIGGIESQCADLARYSNDEEHFYFLWGGGVNTEKIRCYTDRVVVRNLKKINMIKEYLTFYHYVKLNGIRYLIVQGVSPAMLLFAGILKRCHKDIKLVLYLHANAEDLFKKKYVLRLFQWVSIYADGYIAISKSVKKSMTEMIDTNRIKVIYNGTDCARFGHIRKYDVERPIRIIYVGRVVKNKGLDLLIGSLAKITSPFDCTIIGGGNEKNDIISQVGRSGLIKKVHVLGTRSDIEKWLEEADLFVHPARWNEGFGITLIEAMSSGIPCVAFKRGAIPEIIEDGVNGYLVDEVSAGALCEKLHQIIEQRANDPMKYIEISQNAKKRAQRFDIHIYIWNLSRYLETL